MPCRRMRDIWRIIKFIEEREEAGMCDLLDEAENRGRMQGIQALIATCKELGVSFEETAGKLKKRLGLEEAEIERDMKLYW